MTLATASLRLRRRPGGASGHGGFWLSAYRFLSWAYEDLERWERLFGDLYDSPSMHWGEVDDWATWQPPSESEAKAQAQAIRDLERKLLQEQGQAVHGP